MHNKHYGQTDEPIKIPEDEETRQLRAFGEWLSLRYKDATFADLVQAVSNFILIVIGAIAAYIYWGQLNQMIVATNASKSEADTARLSLEVQNRPWLEAAITQSGPLHFGPYGAGIDIKFQLKNVGHTPALDTRYHASIVSLPQKTWVAQEIKDAENQECDNFPNYFFAGSPEFLPVIFPDEQPSPVWPASISAQALGDAVSAKSRGPFRHDGYVTLYLVACVVYRTSYSADLHRSAYGFDLGIPKGPSMWIGDLKPEGIQKDVSLIFMSSLAN
jgi:hypothetical protein